MAEESRKHGRKDTGHKHGGKDMKKADKRHGAKKTGGSGKVGGLTLLERERRLLAEADPFGQRPPFLPAPMPLPEIAPTSESSATPVEDAPVWVPPDPEPRETEELLEGIGVGRVFRRGRIAIAALVVAAACSTTLVRACAPNGSPTEDNAAEGGSCSDDASRCVA